MITKPLIPSPAISTGRLELIPATLPMLIDDHYHNLAGLGRLLGSAIPVAWPPPLLDKEARAHFVTLMLEGSDPHFCLWYWICSSTDGLERTLIGSGGIASGEGDPRTVMIGYSVLEEYQNLGYASEAVRHLVPAIFADPTIRRICATTYPEHIGSIRVLEKNGFIPANPISGGRGMEEGTVMMVRERRVSDSK